MNAPKPQPPVKKLESSASISETPKVSVGSKPAYVLQPHLTSRPLRDNSGLADLLKTLKH